VKLLYPIPDGIAAKGRQMRFPFARYLATAIAFGGQFMSARPVLAADAGAFLLSPRESRAIRLGATYADIRLCNDLGSAGILEAIIGAHEAIQLAPGICARQTGDAIQLRNASAGPVSGIYRSSLNCQMGKGR
jgi:hypothetical protein